MGFKSKQQSAQLTLIDQGFLAQRRGQNGMHGKRLKV
ncbi:hypothetical protein CFP56_043489 [Quercus suber]|uniref:Uncharacterized protein n=1 Tax=Quercus suber TaxID=58331 RepID=A0AAW0LJ02_QUESU